MEWKKLHPINGGTCFGGSISVTLPVLPASGRNAQVDFFLTQWEHKEEQRSDFLDSVSQYSSAFLQRWLLYLVYPVEVTLSVTFEIQTWLIVPKCNHTSITTIPQRPVLGENALTQVS